MEKLIHLAQVEQTLKQMRDFCAYQSDKMLLDEVKHELSSLPTQESGWIALDSLKMKDGERLYIKREGDRYLCNIEGDTGYGFCTLSLGEAISKLSIKPLPKPPLQ